VVVAPQLHVLPDAVARSLAGYVKAGGVLLTDCRTGVKDQTNLCHERTLPGLLAGPLGIAIEEYEGLGRDITYSVTGGEDLPGRFTAHRYADWARPKGAEALARYEDWHMKPFAAATRNRFGRGTGYYVGTVIKEESFQDALIADVLRSARIRPPVAPPPGVEVSLRQGRGRKLLFLLNHTEGEQTVKVPAGRSELLTGKTTGAELTLETYGVAVIRL
jgi:beta-galactosidase